MTRSTAALIATWMMEAACFARLVAALIIAASGTAAAHDAPTGWSYPFACCSGYDCREVPADWIAEKTGGYDIVITGEHLATGDTRLKDSPDGAVHWCSVAGKNDGRTICLFVPPKSF